MRSLSDLRSAWRAYFADFSVALGHSQRPIVKTMFTVLLTAAIELTALLSLTPFIAVVLGERVDLFGIRVSMQSDHRVGLALLSGVIVVLFVVKSMAMLRLQRIITYLAESHRTELMRRLVHSFLVRPYEFHLDKNSATLFSNTYTLATDFTGASLMPLLRLASDGIVIMCLLALLFVKDPLSIAILAAVLLIIFGFVYFNLKSKMIAASAAAAKALGDFWTNSVQAISAVKEIKVLAKEEAFANRLRALEQPLTEATTRNVVLSAIPKIVIESSVVLFLVLFVWLVIALDNNATMLGTLGLLAVSAMRMIPAATSVLWAVNSLRSQRPRLGELATLIRSIDDTQMGTAIASSEPFERFELKDIVYCYPGSETPVFDGINFSVEQGQIIGVMGKSGAGKSTLADILMGLLKPQSGRLVFNGKDVNDRIRYWQRRIAYIPQSILMMDDTLLRNIALGESDHEIDLQRVHLALEQAQLIEAVAAMPNGLQTMLGERGVRLSGGQRQRVAIARALYHDRDVLIMDEATSALDEETEREIIAATGALGGLKTIIVIAHKAAILKHAHKVITVRDGQLEEGLPSYVTREAIA